MRIAILTFHRAYNCGAMLQAWALRTVLERMGHTVEFPVLNHVGESKRWHYPFIRTHGITSMGPWIGGVMRNLLSIPCEDILRYRYARFRKEHLPERHCEAWQLARLYDLIIVGSDQVWNDGISKVDAPVFFAENLPTDIRKIAYAVSCGDDLLSCDRLSRVGQAVPRFEVVSVREKSAQIQLSSISVKRIDETLDPALLLTAAEYDKIAIGEVLNQPYLFMYTLHPFPFFVKTARMLAEKLKVKCVIAPCYQYTRYKAEKGLCYSISPDRMVRLAKSAKYIVAGSFHGTVMGIIFNKPFISLRQQVDPHGSRVASLLDMLGCGNRIGNQETSIDEMEILLRKELDSSVQERLWARREESLAWLRNAVG